jgi:hypothetical protein
VVGHGLVVDGPSMVRDGCGRKNHLEVPCEDKNSPFNMPSCTPIDSCTVVWHGLVVGGWPMMVRDGWGAQKVIEDRPCERQK